jgi:bacillithiol system protein YtxJ
MAEIIMLKTVADLDKLMELSNKQLVFIFKHSTNCPISARAYGDYTDFVRALTPETPVYCGFVRVIEERDISNAISKRLAVKHESPQLLLLWREKVIWHDSHWTLTKQKMREVLKDHLPPP